MDSVNRVQVIVNGPVHQTMDIGKVGDRQQQSCSNVDI